MKFNPIRNTYYLILLFLGIALTSQAQDRTADDQAIRNIVATMENGWNSRNGKLFATYFAPRHDYIVWSGMYLPNLTLDSNAMAHQGIFNSIYKSTDLELKLDKVRYVREDIAVVHVLGATYEHGAAVPALPEILITMVMEKLSHGWQIVSFHNSDIEILRPDSPPSSGPPPHVMFAGWNRAEP